MTCPQRKRDMKNHHRGQGTREFLQDSRPRAAKWAVRNSYDCQGRKSPQHGLAGANNGYGPARGLYSPFFPFLNWSSISIILSYLITIHGGGGLGGHLVNILYFNLKVPRLYTNQPEILGSEADWGLSPLKSAKCVLDLGRRIWKERPRRSSPSNIRELLGEHMATQGARTSQLLSRELWPCALGSACIFH